MKILDLWLIKIRFEVAKQTKNSCCWSFKAGKAKAFYNQSYFFRRLVYLKLMSEVKCSKHRRIGERWFVLQMVLFELVSTTSDLRFKHTCSERLFLALNDLPLSAENISPWCQMPDFFQPEADENLSSAPFRQTSIKNLEMLKASQPRNNQIVACLKNDMFQTF